jgi:hypothetical protein
MKRHRSRALSHLVVALGLGAGEGAAQQYPSGPIR